MMPPDTETFKESTHAVSPLVPFGIPAIFTKVVHISRMCGLTPLPSLPSTKIVGTFGASESISQALSSKDVPTI